MNIDDQSAATPAPGAIDGHTRDWLHTPLAGHPSTATHDIDAQISRLRQIAFDTFLDEHTAAGAIDDATARKAATDAANLRYSTRMNEIDMQMNNPAVYERAVSKRLASTDGLPLG
jgi:hypothetical protein